MLNPIGSEEETELFKKAGLGTDTMKWQSCRALATPWLGPRGGKMIDLGLTVPAFKSASQTATTCEL